MDDTQSVTSKKPVSLRQIAGEFNLNFSAIRRACARWGYEPFRLSEGINQPLFLSEDDANALRKIRQNKLDNVILTNNAVTLSKLSGVYIIEVPSFGDQARVKVGWSDSIMDRISTYRTIVPDLRVLAVWQTTDAWCERAALRCAEMLGKKVHQELFEFDDAETFLADVTDMFAKMGITKKPSESCVFTNKENQQ